MQLNPALPLLAAAALHHAPTTKSAGLSAAPNRNDNAEAFAEIAAYMAIRDRLLAEAEVTPTQGKLDRTLLANEFVENCLRPARTPYEAQHLREIDAISARKRCVAVKARIEALRR